MISKLDKNIRNTSENIFKNNNSIISNLNNLIIANNLVFDNYFPSLIEKKYKELSFINSKRINLNNQEKKTQNILDKNEKSFNFNLNEKIINEFDLLKNLNKKKKRIFYICKDYAKYKDNNHFSPSKIYKIENNNSIFINKSVKEANYLENSIIHKDNIKGGNLSNTITVKKNNKMVYMNKFLIKQKKKNNDVILEKKKRSSLYRGVSKNGNNWQVIIFSKHSKGYVGVFKTQEIAARIYDIVSIKNKGIKAKTNFQYNIHQIQKISETYINYNAENIEEIISDLIKK